MTGQWFKWHLHNSKQNTEVNSQHSYIAHAEVGNYTTWVPMAQHSVLCTSPGITLEQHMLKKVSCAKVFRQDNVLPHASEFVPHLLPFVVENLEKCHRNSHLCN